MKKKIKSGLLGEECNNSGFGLNNIPFGVFMHKQGKIRCGTRIGDCVIDLNEIADRGYFKDIPLPDLSVFKKPSLNAFISMGRPVWSAVRNRIIELFGEKLPFDDHDRKEIDTFVYPVEDVTMLMPVEVKNYTDFYSGMHHAVNVGKMFRDPDNPLLPNWKHIPVGYHGRASSIVVSGTPFHRPKGQILKPEQDSPVFGPTEMLDFELEVAFITRGDTILGDSIPIEHAEDHIFGIVLFNDLSARDIQKWEYVPLGPFQGKSFASVVSPWVITLEALEPFRIKGLPQDPKPLPYLAAKGEKHLDIDLEVEVKNGNGVETVLCRSNLSHLYWSMAQQLAHQTANGCNIYTGDMYASGTISGPEEGSFGSMLEITRNGTNPVALSDGSLRKYLNDNDTVIMRGYKTKGSHRIGFGECVTTVLPAKE